MADYWIAPSILSADFARLGEEVSNVLDAGADVVHFDVMDNHFVPNLTVGPMVCKSLREYGIDAVIDVHLMIEPVDQLIPPFANAGADIITFHPEASDDVARTLALIKQQGCKAGLVLNPETPLDVALPHIEELDVLLLMSVNPGFGGQSFIPQTLTKIRQARALLDEKQLPTRLQVDGGINLDNIAEIARAGADMFVAGSAIFASDDYQATLSQMRAQLAQAESK
ncbi:ribulose-phosphate 3-epimerase [Thalassotalea mangrovi]|uniref:Ribulose-phosphate 3-epimerase n=1 Tax=Thalassotalea mangrovi TaxID=2572245 RepID=A0A4U1B9J5_9GAMM|nr:ribulose-phosphate 3-epimerase [Thalassotalea mangrovi]TKB46741.1 ribulose-phosphate 3-epimerase [Thalassotalea mangrovi]